MNKHIALNPCPFCSAGLTLDIDEGGGVAILHSLKTEKNCWFPSIVEVEMPVGTTLEEMTEIINRRPIEDALNARIAELEAENAALKAPKEWISVEDGLPNTDFFSDFVYVLLYHKGYKSVCVDRLRRIGDFDRYEWTIHPFKDSNKYPVVVAWSPLPEPPEEE